ncbi:MAG: sigma-70 family RNA polymerase sigma factor [Tepidisphaera sp.]|nr:sigma-70 family RNA polymerase sigma factor [Tepidisphaera sp.]
MAYERETLTDLARRVAQADAQAFAQVHERLGASLRRLLTQRCNDPELAEELAQKAWAGVWEAVLARRYDPDKSAISTFVYAVAHHAWLKHLRSKRTTNSATSLAEDFVASSHTAAHDSVALSEVLEAIRKAVAGEAGDLTEQERWLLRHARDGLTDRALASRMGVSPSTAHQARRSAMAKLRRLLGRQGLGDENDDAEPGNSGERGQPERE